MEATARYDPRAASGARAPLIPRAGGVPPTSPEVDCRFRDRARQ